MSKAERSAYVLASLVALVSGGVMLAYYLAGLLDKYLDVAFRNHCLIAGVILVIMALFNLLTLRHGGSGGHEHEGCCGHDHDHDHGHDDGEEEGDEHHHAFFGGDSLGASLVATLLLCGTVAGAAVFSPHSYSPQAIMNKGLYNPTYGATRSDRSLGGEAEEKKEEKAVAEVETETGTETTTSDLGAFSLADLEAQVDRDGQGYFELEVPELYYTAGDLEVRRVLEGQPVVTVAQVMPEKYNDPEGTRLRIFKLFVECCVADARPLSIPIDFGKPPPEVREMGWVQVRGKMTYKLEGGVTVPILLAEEMAETEEPEQTMMY